MLSMMTSKMSTCSFYNLAGSKMVVDLFYWMNTSLAELGRTFRFAQKQMHSDYKTLEELYE